MAQEDTAIMPHGCSIFWHCMENTEIVSEFESENIKSSTKQNFLVGNDCIPSVKVDLLKKLGRTGDIFLEWNKDLSLNSYPLFIFSYFKHY